MKVNKFSRLGLMLGVLQATLLLTLFVLSIFVGSIISQTPNEAHANAAYQSAEEGTISNEAIWTASAHQTITITGQNDAAHDLSALETALANASSGDTVILDGIFDLSNCENQVNITKNITIRGTSDPNEVPANASQVHGCGPAFIVNIPEEVNGALTIKNIYFRDQEIISIQLLNSVNPVNIVGNRFTGNIPVDLNGTMARFAVGVAQVGPLTITGAITIENNHIDWSDYPHNDTFVGDDNGFAFAAGDVSVVVRNNYIKSLGEAIEIEGNFGQENTYLVAGNVIRTEVPASPTGESSGPPGSVADGLQGGHPAAIKLHANEGTFVIHNNDVALTGLPFGVCMMATTLNTEALAGKAVHLIHNNTCTMDGQLTAILGAWGQTQPFFNAAFLSGAVVSRNIISGTGSVGIGMISRTSVPFLGSVINYGHDNHFFLNDFTHFTAIKADIGFDPQTFNNVVNAWPDNTIIDLGANEIRTQILFLPQISKD